MCGESLDCPGARHPTPPFPRRQWERVELEVVEVADVEDMEVVDMEEVVDVDMEVSTFVCVCVCVCVCVWKSAKIICFFTYWPESAGKEQYIF